MPTHSRIHPKPQAPSLKPQASSPKPQAPSLKSHLLAASCFAAIALWLTWPQAALLGDAIVGGPIALSDGWQNVWNFWWIKTALLSGQSPLATDRLFWPDGVPLGLHTLTMSGALLTLPVLLLAGPVAAYGVLALLNFALSGLLTYLLGLRVLRSWAGALAAGLAVELAPLHQARFLDGQHHTSLQWVALYLLALLHATARPTWRSGLWLGLCAALIAYTSWYQALFVAMLTLVWLLFQATAERRGWALLRPWLTALPLLLLLLLPVVPGLLQGVSEAGRSAAHWRTQAQFYSADLVDLLLPSALHPLWGPAVTAYQEPLHPNSIGWMIAPGYLTLALAALGMVLDWQASRPWALLVGVLLLFALGPSLRIAGYDTGVPLPFALLSYLPGAAFGRRPSLITVVALLPLTLLAGLGVRALLARLPGWRGPALLGVVLALALFESAPSPMLIMRDDTAPLYATLRGGAGAVLEVPLPIPGNTRGLAEKSAAQRAQMTHGRPIIGGYVARPPDYPLVNAPLLHQLSHEGCEPIGVVPEDAATALAALASYRISQLVVHSDRLSATQRRCVTELLAGMGLPPARQDGPMAIYDLPPAPPQPFVFLGDGWLALEHEGTRSWRWLSGRGEIYLVNPDAAPRTMALRLYMIGYATLREMQLRLDQRSLGTITIDAQFGRIYTLWLTLPPGQHRLELSGTTTRESGGRDVSVALLRGWLEPTAP